MNIQQMVSDVELHRLLRAEKKDGLQIRFRSCLRKSEAKKLIITTFIECIFPVWHNIETWNGIVNNTDTVVSPCARSTKLLKEKKGRIKEGRTTHYNWWHKRKELMAESQGLWMMQDLFWICW